MVKAERHGIEIKPNAKAAIMQWKPDPYADVLQSMTEAPQTLNAIAAKRTAQQTHPVPDPPDSLRRYGAQRAHGTRKKPIEANMAAIVPNTRAER